MDPEPRSPSRIALRRNVLCRAWCTVDPRGERSPRQNGRYGPYLKRAAAILDAEDQMFTIALDEALKIYAAEASWPASASATTAPATAVESGVEGK